MSKMCPLFCCFLLLSNTIACAETEEVSDASVEVQRVTVTATDDGYTFNVTLKSDDTGCDQYADWWEVTDEAGEALYYRRVLGHSHIDEQPFTRSGEVVDVTATQTLIIRGHLNPTGYGAQALKGTIDGGFVPTTLPDGFGSALESAAPQPSGCAF